MTTEGMCKSYLLRWDLSELRDDEFFAFALSFPGIENTMELAVPWSLALPETVFFTGNVERLGSLDFPYNNVRWPIMSSRMASLLDDEAALPCRQTPVVILDDTVDKSEHFLEDGTPNPDHALEGFVAVQLLRHLDIFDWDNSEYTPSPHADMLVDGITKLVLKDTMEVRPPLFRISADPVLLFVSAEARDSLRRAGMRGMVFDAIE